MYFKKHGCRLQGLSIKPFRNTTDLTASKISSSVFLKIHLKAHPFSPFPLKTRYRCGQTYTYKLVGLCISHESCSTHLPAHLRNVIPVSYFLGVFFFFFFYCNFGVRLISPITTCKFFWKMHLNWNGKLHPEKSDLPEKTVETSTSYKTEHLFLFHSIVYSDDLWVH